LIRLPVWERISLCSRHRLFWLLNNIFSGKTDSCCHFLPCFTFFKNLYRAAVESLNDTIVADGHFPVAILLVELVLVLVLVLVLLGRMQKRMMPI
jgi:hypothetical protein